MGESVARQRQVGAVQRTGEDSQAAGAAIAVASEPAPGTLYQIRKGDSLLAVAGRAFGVPAGQERLRMARLINDDSRNRRFHTTSIPSAEANMFGGSRISFSPRFGKPAEQLQTGEPASGGHFAIIRIPAGGAPTPVQIEEIEAPDTIAPPAQVPVRARLAEAADAGPRAVVWQVVVAGDRRQIPGAQVSTGEGGAVALLHTDESVAGVGALEIHAAIDPADLGDTGAATAPVSKVIQVQGGGGGPGGDGPAAHNDLTHLMFRYPDFARHQRSERYSHGDAVDAFRGDVFDLRGQRKVPPEDDSVFETQSRVFWNFDPRHLSRRPVQDEPGTLRAAVPHDAAPTTTEISASTARRPDGALVDPLVLQVVVRDPLATSQKRAFDSCEKREKEFERRSRAAFTALAQAHATLLADPGMADGRLRIRINWAWFRRVFLAGLPRADWRDTERVRERLGVLADRLAGTRNALVRQPITYVCDDTEDCCRNSNDAKDERPAACTLPTVPDRIWICTKNGGGSMHDLAHEAAHLGGALADPELYFQDPGWKALSLEQRLDMADAIALFGLRGRGRKRGGAAPNKDDKET